MTDDKAPTLDDVVNMELEAGGERRWMVLFDEDYDDMLLDAEDSVAVLLDYDQALEVLRLANEIVSALAPADAPDDEPVGAMIKALEEVRDDR